MTDQVYLDYNASAPLCDDAKQAMIAAMDVAGNPSSVHASGRAARKIVDHARRTIADLVGGDSERIVFTSGGTEANNLALKRIRGRHRIYQCGRASLGHRSTARCQTHSGGCKRRD